MRNVQRFWQCRCNTQGSPKILRQLTIQDVLSAGPPMAQASA